MVREQRLGHNHAPAAHLLCLHDTDSLLHVQDRHAQSLRHALTSGGVREGDRGDSHNLRRARFHIREGSEMFRLTWPTEGISGVDNKGPASTPPRFKWPSEKPGTDQIGDLQHTKELIELITVCESTHLTACMVFTVGIWG